MRPPATFHILEYLVSKVSCKPRWGFQLIELDGFRTLQISVPGRDSYHPDQTLRVHHHFPVPEATYNMRTWQRWIFERCRKVENHELSEWFKIDGRRPFAPLHGPGEDPYTIHEYRDPADAQIVQDGSIDEEIKV